MHHRALLFRPSYAWLAALLCTACGSPMIDLETDGSGTESATGESATDPDDTGQTTPRQVDILFVIDNSGSMGEEQSQLAASIGTLVDTLDAATPSVDYRIGVTTSDNGNPWCQGTGPEGGELRATSCRSRPTEFVFEGSMTVDVAEEACLQHCSLETIDLGGDVWLEWNNSTASGNISADQVQETLRCMLPQGINGCGFESTLESTREALSRSTQPGDVNLGFLRPGALTAVLVITDEADCSYNNDWETIFLPDGDRRFWSDDQSPAPTSAVCWNAGVVCEGSGTYDDCRAANLDVNGDEVDQVEAEAEAVLRPTTRYSSLLGELDAYVVAITGVNEDGSITYADAPASSSFQGDFGIGPGCASTAGEAVPPVRIREVVEQVSGPGNLHSVCAGDYSAAFSSFADGILSRL